VVDGVVRPFAGVSWLQPFPLALGVLTLVLCAYLAALYLALTTRGNVGEDFRRRGLGVGLVAGVVSVFALALPIADAPRLWEGLSLRAAPALVLGVLLRPPPPSRVSFGAQPWDRGRSSSC